MYVCINKNIMEHFRCFLKNPHILSLCFFKFVVLIRGSCILSCQHIKVLLTSSQKNTPYGRLTSFTVTDALHNSVNQKNIMGI